MAVMGERLPEAWMVELHRNGRVEFPLRRWSTVRPPALLVVSATLLGTGRIPDMLDSEWRHVAYLLIVVYVALWSAIVWQLVTRRPVVVIDRRGIHRGRRQFMAWSDIGSIGPVSGPKMARQLSVRPKNVRAKNLVLTQNHVNDLHSFATWLNDVLDHQRHPTPAEPADETN